MIFWELSSFYNQIIYVLDAYYTLSVFIVCRIVMVCKIVEYVSLFSKIFVVNECVFLQKVLMGWVLGVKLV